MSSDGSEKKRLTDILPPVPMAHESTERTEGLPSHERRVMVSFGDGPERRLITIAGVELVFGTGDECDIVVHDGTVSRRHFAIFRDGLSHLVRDLGSTNGTFVDGVRVREVYVYPGVTIRAGRTTFLVESDK